VRVWAVILRRAQDGAAGAGVGVMEVCAGPCLASAAPTRGRPEGLPYVRR